MRMVDPSILRLGSCHDCIDRLGSSRFPLGSVVSGQGLILEWVLAWVLAWELVLTLEWAVVWALVLALEWAVVSL